MSACFGNINPNVELCPGLQQLKNEHVELLQMLNELKSLSKVFLKFNENVICNFKSLTESLTVFFSQLAPHSEKEEDVLFQMMGKYLPPTGGPIEVMEAEHDRAKRLIEQYFAIVNNEGAEISVEQMKRLALSVIQVHEILTNHFMKEENVLFPMAENMFSQEEKHILNEQLIK